MRLFAFHLKADRLAQLADEGGTRPTERESRHLAGCPRCQHLLEGHRRARALFDRINIAVAPPRPQSAAVSATFALNLALSVLVVAVVAVLISDAQRRPVGVGKPGQTWHLLAGANTVTAWWSPDGQWLLIAGGLTNGTLDQQVITLRDRSGSVVRTMQGYSALWVDARTFLILTGDPGVTGSQTRSLLGSIGSTGLARVGPPIMGGPAEMVEIPVSNGHGAVAYPLSIGYDASSAFAVWTPTGTSAAVSGLPEEWSPDGRHLLVWHWTSGGGAAFAHGWLEVLSWPGLHSEAQLKREDVSPGGVDTRFFDPRSNYLLVRNLVALSTGRAVASLPPGAVGPLVWDSDGQIVDFPLHGGDASVFDVHGKQVATIPGAARSAGSAFAEATASADGSLLVSWTMMEAGPITTIRNTTVQKRITPPGPVFGVYPAPDGSVLVVVCATDTGAAAFLRQP